MQVHQILAGKKIDNIYFVSPEQTVYDALEIMEEKNIGAVLVMESGEMVGIFSERDYARKGILRGRASRDTLIKEVMTSKVITVETEQKLQECMEIMSEKHIRHLPVTKEGQLVGIISINDIVTMIIREQRSHILSLESYITGNPY